MWFTEFQGNKLGKITLTLDGNFAALTETPIPTSNSGPVSVSFIGTDVWFTETIANKIGLLRSDGFIEFPVPTQNSGLSGIYSNYYEGIAWFTESRGNKIGFVTEDGRFTEYAVPTPASEPFGITAGQVNGQVVFTERTGNAVSRFQGDALVVLAARDLGGWTTEFDIANVEAQKTFILGSFTFPEITVCGVCPPQLLLPLGPHGSAKATASQVTLGSLRSVFFRSLVDGILPNVHARLVNSAAPRGSIEAPSIRLSTLAAMDPSILVFPGAVRQAGAHSNLLITEVSTLSYLRFINTSLQVLVEAFSDTGELVGSASFGVVGDSGSIYLVDILGRLGVAELPLGQLRVTKTGGGGIMWGYLLTAKSDGTFAVSLGATP